MEKPFNVTDDKTNTLFNILFKNAQDKNFKVFENKADNEILSVLQNGNVGFNNVNGNIYLCINIDGRLYKRSVSIGETVLPGISISSVNVSGTDWYIVLSNGFKIQGGRATANTARNFNTPFDNTDYTIVGSFNNSNQDEAIAFYNRTTTGFKIVSDRNVACDWIACGK